MCSLEVLPQLVTLLKANRPEGLALMDVSKEFYNMFGYRLNPYDYNCNTLYEMIEKLSQKCDNSVVLVKHHTKQFKTDRIFIDEKAYNRWTQTFKSNEEIGILEGLVLHILPEDVPKQKNKIALIPASSVPSEAFGPQIMSFRAEVIHVDHPNLMFMRLLRNKHIYLTLKHKMRFYDGTDEETRPYVLPQELAVVGYRCAVKNPKDWENWHRAIIVETMDDVITLYAIDYGNVIVEDRKALRLLKKSMCEDPPQIIRVSLAGIMPFFYDVKDIEEGVWSQESTQYLKYALDKYKIDIECIFLKRLHRNFYSVFLQSSVESEKEDFPKQFSVYFHEMLIKNGFADMFSSDFSEYIFPNSSQNIVSEAIEEPLLAIKYEPEGDGYESPAIRPEDIKSEKCDKQSVSESGTEPVKTNSDPTTPEGDPQEINYKRFFFTADKCPDTLLYKYFCHSGAEPLIKRKYFNEDMLEKEFPSYERKYFNGDEKEMAFPSFMFKYYRPQSKDDYKVRAKYMTSDESPFVEHKYFPNNEM